MLNLQITYIILRTEADITTFSKDELHFFSQLRHYRAMASRGKEEEDASEKNVSHARNERLERVMKLYAELQKIVYVIFNDVQNTTDLTNIQKLLDKHDLRTVIKSFANKRGLNVGPGDIMKIIVVMDADITEFVNDEMYLSNEERKNRTLFLRKLLEHLLTNFFTPEQNAKDLAKEIMNSRVLVWLQ